MYKTGAFGRFFVISRGCFVLSEVGDWSVAQGGVGVQCVVSGVCACSVPCIFYVCAVLWMRVACGGVDARCSGFRGAARGFVVVFVFFRGAARFFRGGRRICRGDLVVFLCGSSCLTAVKKMAHGCETIVALLWVSVLTIVRRLNHVRATVESRLCGVFCTAVSRGKCRRVFVSSRE